MAEPNHPKLLANYHVRRAVLPPPSLKIVDNENGNLLINIIGFNNVSGYLYLKTVMILS